VHRLPTRPDSRALVSTAAVAAVVACTLGVSAASAATAPTPIETVSATAVVDTLGVYAATGENFYQDGVVDPQRDRLYLATPGATGEGLVTVELSTGASSWMPLGGDASVSDVAVSPLDGTVYVSHSSGTLPTVSVLDPTVTYTTGSPAPAADLTERSPQRLEVSNDGRVFVASFSPWSISVLGASTGPDRTTVVQTITEPSSGGGFTAMDVAGERLFMVSDIDNTVIVVDVASSPAAVVGRFVLAKKPTGATFDAVEGQLAVVSDDNTVSWLQPDPTFGSATVVRTVPLAPLPAGADPFSTSPSLAIMPDGTAIAVTEVTPFTLRSFATVIPPATSTDPVTSLQVGSDGFAVVPDYRAGGTAYIPNIGSGTVSVISRLSLTSYATTHSLGSDGLATARLQRADGRRAAGSVAFTAPDGSVVTSAVDATGTAVRSIAGLPIGSRDYTAAVTAPAGVALSARSSVTTVAAVAGPGATPTGELANTGMDATGLAATAAALLAAGLLSLVAAQARRRRASRG